MNTMYTLYMCCVVIYTGWKLLLQIHDEVILEGPVEFRDVAMKEVLSCMEQPFDGIGLTNMLVKLEVDAKSADSWYRAK